MVPVGLISALAILGVGLLMATEHRYNTLLDEAAKAGMSVRAEDFAKFDVPDADNSEPHYQQAFHRHGLLSKADAALLKAYAPNITEKSFSQSSSASYTGPDPGTAARAAASKWKGIFAEVEKATAKPYLNFKRPWVKGAEVIFPELAQMKSVSHGLMSDAVIQLEDGNTPLALKRLDQVRTMARHLREEPTLIAQLVTVAIETRTDAYALRMAAAQPQNDTLMTGLREYMRAKPLLPDFERGLGGEAFFLTVLLDHAANNPEDVGVMEQDTELRWYSRALKVKWLRRSAQTTSLTAYLEVWKVLKKDPEDWVAIENALKTFDRRLASDKSLSGKLAQAFTPQMAQLGETCRRVLNRRRLARITLELLTTKQRVGSFPTALPKSEDNVDLHSNKPFTYRRTADGFLLYGTDTDGKNDGGTAHKDWGVLVAGRTLEIGRR